MRIQIQQSGGKKDRYRSGSVRRRWLAAIAGVVVCAGLFALEGRSNRHSIPPVLVGENSPEEREYRRLLAAHVSARNGVLDWIRTDIAGRKSLSPPPNALMKSRIQQRFNPLVGLYQDFIKRNPGHLRAGQSYRMLREDLEAESGLLKQWEQAHGIDLRDPDAWRQLAHYYGHIGEIKRGFQCYAKAIELDPTEPVYYRDYALSVFLYRRDARDHFHETEQQVFDRALELYGQALRLDPKNGPLALEIAECFYIIRPPRAAAALQAWQRVLALASTDRQRQQVYLNLARVEIAGEHFVSARKYLNLVKFPQLERIKGRVANTLAEREKGEVNTASTATKAGADVD